MQGVFLKSPHISSGWPCKRRSAALHHNYYQILGLVPAVALESAIFLSLASYEQMSCSDRPQCHAYSPNTHPASGKTHPASFWSQLPFPSHPPSIWFNVCVNVIALRWKGLASHNAKKKKKKKKFPPSSTRTSSDMIGVSPLFTTAGAFLHPWGLFCTFCSTQLTNSDHTHSQSLYGGV